ncbi:MAG: STAS-like domain-containing protein [Candidatus Contendobacter sp.]|nr:STAS-like domain-containing protein [Candidatus Contendobacter sp.]
MAELNIGVDFSVDPSGRYYSDGPASGEQFREECLRPRIEALKPNEKLKIILDDGVEGYGSSFLVEGFAGMVRYGYMRSEQLLALIQIQYSNSDFEFYRDKIISYVSEAAYQAEEYRSKKTK